MKDDFQAILRKHCSDYIKISPKIAKLKVRNVWWRLSPAEKIYCQVRNATGDDNAAFVTAFPSEKHISPSAMRKRIYRLNCANKVQRYTQALEEQFDEETSGKYVALREKMIRSLLDTIEAMTENNPMWIITSKKELRQLSRILGRSSMTAR